MRWSGGVVMTSPWRIRGVRFAACACSVAVLSMPLAAQRPAAKSLGTIHFPSSAKPAAQKSFLTGVKALFNFEFDIAAEAFQQTEKADPDFALGYWGEAM